MSARSLPDTHHQFQSRESATLLSEVACVQCVLLPRALLLAGFSADGEVLLIRYNNYSKELPEWSCDFFEHEFINEPLLGVPLLVKSLFAGSEHQMVIPDAFYNAAEAGKWLHQLHPMPKDEWLQHYTCTADEATYLFGIPQSLHKLLQRYFGHTTLMPLAAYQFYKPNAKRENVLQCIIANDLVFATLRKTGKLYWHQVFEYQTVEDIAWQFASLCKQQGLKQIDLNIECTTLCDACFDLAPNLQTFFPKLKWTNKQESTNDLWSPVVYLLEQSYACAL